MSKGYSIDLRERVLASLDAGISKMTAHLLLRISRPTIDRWIALREQTGSLAPRALPQTCQPQLQGAAFEEFAQRHAHATLSEMAQAWREERGVSLTAMSFSRALRGLGWTRKKRVGATKSATKRRGRSS
jgi:transposase